MEKATARRCREDTLWDRFWPKVDAEGDCWIWKAYALPSGYGMVATARGREYAHRVAWRLLIDDVPDGLVIDHLCRVRRCVNPDHLEPVAAKTNHARARATGAVQCRKREACQRGHDLNQPENLYIDQRGGRRCKPCTLAKQRAYDAARKVVPPPSR